MQKKITQWLIKPWKRIFMKLLLLWRTILSVQDTFRYETFDIAFFVANDRQWLAQLCNLADSNLGLPNPGVSSAIEDIEDKFKIPFTHGATKRLSFERKAMCLLQIQHAESYANLICVRLRMFITCKEIPRRALSVFSQERQRVAGSLQGLRKERKGNRKRWSRRRRRKTVVKALAEIWYVCMSWSGPPNLFFPLTHPANPAATILIQRTRIVIRTIAVTVVIT